MSTTNDNEFSHDQESFILALESGQVNNFHIHEKQFFSTPRIGGLAHINNCKFEKEFGLGYIQVNQNLTFSNCIFKGDVNFDNINILEDLIFQSCTFEKRLIINNISFKNLRFENGIYGKIEFNGSINLDKSYPSKISFEAKKIESLHITCKEINTTVLLADAEFTSIFISHSNFNSELILEGEELKFSILAFDSCTFNKRVDFKKNLSADTLYINRTNFNQSVFLNEDFLCEYITFTSVVAKQRVSLSARENFGNLTISDCDFLSSFECYPGMQEKIKPSEQLAVSISGVIRGNLIFENLEIPSIDIGCSNFGNIVFRNIETHFITLKDFLNYNKLTFANLKLVYERHILIIFDSNIDKTEFVNVDFRKFDELIIARSEVSNIILSNSILPPRIQIASMNPKLGYAIPEDERLDINTYHRENYRQLKQAMERQGNKSAALLYKSREMHYLRKETKWGWDKILLNLNYLSNNHGLSWTRAILFTLCTSILMFILFQLSLKSPKYNFPINYSYNQIKNASLQALDSLAEFLASFPVYRTQSEVADNWKAYLVIMVARIFIGYGVYQTITAFRKFGAK